jgi:hypothetical protein
MDENKVSKQLKKINNLLVEEAKQRGLLVIDPKTKIWMIDPLLRQKDNENYLPHRKILRDILEKELGRLGFTPELCKATGLLIPPAFRATLTNGSLLKDPGAGVAHGEFIHAIQWLLIAWENQDSSFLSNLLITFKDLGNANYTATQSGKSAFLEKTIWDIIVDSTDAKDYRSPEYMQSALLNHTPEDNTSLIKELVASRNIKRTLEENNKFKYNLSQHKLQYPNKQYNQDNNSTLLWPKISLVVAENEGSMEEIEKQPTP